MAPAPKDPLGETLGPLAIHSRLCIVVGADTADPACQEALVVEVALGAPDVGQTVQHQAPGDLDDLESLPAVVVVRLVELRAELDGEGNDLLPLPVHHRLCVAAEGPRLPLVAAGGLPEGGVKAHFVLAARGCRVV